MRATLQSVRSQLLLNTRIPVRTQIVHQLKRDAAKPFRSGLLKFEVELCEKLAECSDIKTSDPIEKRLDVVRAILSQMIQEDPVLGAVLSRIRDEYEGSIKGLKQSRDDAGRISSMSLQRIADENDKMSRNLNRAREECDDKTRRLNELAHRAELLEIDNESQKEQIIDLTNRLAANAPDQKEADNDDLCKYMTGELHQFEDEPVEVSARGRKQTMAKQSIKQAEKNMTLLETERGEVEAANKLAEDVVSRINEQYQSVVSDWRRKHTALYGAANQFRIDVRSDDEGA